MKTAVLGLGNVLMGDDAFGPWVLQCLWAHYGFPAEVSVEDLGTPGLDLLPFLTGHEALIVVDTVRSQGQPGELRLYRQDEILRHAPGPRVSPHDPGLKEALLSLQFSGDAPGSVLLVGCIPEHVDSRIGLSDAVRGAIPAAEAAVIEELDRLGHESRELAAPDSIQPWWEEPSADPRGGPA